MRPLRLRTPDEIEQTDPLRARYVRLLTHSATAGEPEQPSAMDVGLVLCDVLAGRPMRAVEVDAATLERRPFAAPLVRYARTLAEWLKGSSHAGAAAPDEPEHQADLNLTDTHAHPGLPPRRGLSAESAARWSADALDALASLDVSNVMPPPIATVIASQADIGIGAFFAFDGQAGDNPEPWWYHELILLHAVTSYALLTGDATALDASRKAAAFHHAETQPDHATSQPWAIHAFLADPEFVPTADLMLLSTGVNQPGGLGAVPRILLADAAVCLSLA